MKQVVSIGCGGYAVNYMENFLRLAQEGKIGFSGIVIRNPAKYPEQTERLQKAGVRIFPDTKNMYENLGFVPDLVGIPAGIDFHEAYTVEALEHGCNVMVEKPAAGSAQSVKNMMLAQAKAGRFAAVGFQHMYAPSVRRIKEILVSGKLGKVLSVRTLGLWPRNDAYYSRNSWVGKRFSPAGVPIMDSPINNAFAHYLNIALFLCGDSFRKTAVPVSLRAELYRARKTIETFDSCAVIGKTAGGAEFQALFSHATDTNFNPEVRIVCEKGTALWTHIDDWYVKDADGKVLDSGTMIPPLPGMFDIVTARLEDDSQFIYPLEDAMRQVQCIDAIAEMQVSETEEKFITRAEKDGQLSVKDLPEVFHECFDKGVLPSQCTCEWACTTQEAVIR